MKKAKVFINLISDAPNVSYQFTDNTKGLVEFDYTFDEFEVTDDENKGAILQIQEFTAGATIEHDFNDTVLASVGVGGVFNRILKFKNETGKAVLDNGLYISIKIDADF